jgi:hypothetical protein
MSFLLQICFTLLFILAAGGIVGVCFRLLIWRLFIGAALPPCLVSAVILAIVGPGALLTMSESQGGAILMLVIGSAPFYYGAFGTGILLGDFLRKRMASKTNLRPDT